MLDHVLTDPVAGSLILAREWHSEAELEVIFAFTGTKVFLFEVHGVLDLGLVFCKSISDFLLIIRLGDLLLENSEFGLDLSLVLLELLHSSHVEHLLSLEVLGLEIRIAVLHKVVADLLVHDQLPCTVVL